MWTCPLTRIVVFQNRKKMATTALLLYYVTWGTFFASWAPLHSTESFPVCIFGWSKRCVFHNFKELDPRSLSWLCLRGGFSSFTATQLNLNKPTVTAPICPHILTVIWLFALSPLTEKKTKNTSCLWVTSQKNKQLWLVPASIGGRDRVRTA